MKMIQSVVGFTIIECLVYVLVMIVSVRYFFDSTMLFYTKQRDLFAQLGGMLDVVAVVDSMAAEIRQAPLLVDRWDQRSVTFLLWHGSKGLFGWSFDKGIVYSMHKEGDYGEMHNHRMVRKEVLRGVSECSMVSYESGGLVRAIGIHIVTPSYSVDRIITLKKGAVV